MPQSADLAISDRLAFVGILQLIDSLTGDGVYRVKPLMCDLNKAAFQ